MSNLGEPSGPTNHDLEPSPWIRTSPRDVEPVPDGMIRRALATLDPGYFALVMASGIVSVGTNLTGHPLLSGIVLWFTMVAFVALVLAYAVRIAYFDVYVRQSLRDPTTAMAYFTVVAGTDVLGARLAMAHHPLVALGLGAAAAIVWVVLSYGLPWSIVATAHRPVLGEFNGTWLVWVVATQSLSIVATAITAHAASSWLAADLPVIAVCLWGVGVMLYLIFIVIIFLRLLLIRVSPAEMSPAYWIAMGATAISVRAAAGILSLHGPHTTALVTALRPFLTGLSVVLWAFGTWWIPLLILFGIWRHVIRHYSKAYEPQLWSVVFPLGMYAVASYTLGQTPGLGFMITVARAAIWVAVGAWAVVLVLMLAASARALHARRTSITET
ncbi:MAG TPA: tellurite resistance/C4-dicarboxylate transporter family protein [Acidimicrobiales bacterium]|nr:tellurite resistance/C4-dicarboxylate transporter family protein [Acidimicrobiales bacterium]